MIFPHFKQSPLRLALACMLSPPLKCIINDDRGNYFLPVPVSTSDTYTSLLNLSLFQCLYFLSLNELVDFKNT